MFHFETLAGHELLTRWPSLKSRARSVRLSVGKTQAQWVLEYWLEEEDQLPLPDSEVRLPETSG